MKTNSIYQIPIGRRVGEILEERGSAFSIRAFSSRIGLSKDMLSRMISGERYMSPSEIELIARGLSVNVARLNNEDSTAELEELRILLDKNSNPERALRIAQRIHKAALGRTERCDASNLLARALFELGRYEEAHMLWLEAYNSAYKLAEIYNDSDRLYEILSKLMMSFTARKEYSQLTSILSTVEPIFVDQPAKLGAIYYSKAMMADQFGKIEEMGEFFYKSLDYLKQSGLRNQVGRAELNIGYYEFRNRNYEVAKEHLELALEDLGEDKTRNIALKEYIKTLIKLGYIDQSVRIIEDTLSSLDNTPELEGKFLLLLSISKGEASYAESVVRNMRYPGKVRNIACVYLMKYYSLQGDSILVMKYYREAEMLARSRTSDILHKEEF